MSPPARTGGPGTGAAPRSRVGAHLPIRVDADATLAAPARCTRSVLLRGAATSSGAQPHWGGSSASPPSAEGVTPRATAASGLTSLDCWGGRYARAVSACRPPPLLRYSLSGERSARDMPCFGRISHAGSPGLEDRLPGDRDRDRVARLRAYAGRPCHTPTGTGSELVRGLARAAVVQPDPECRVTTDLPRVVRSSMSWSAWPNSSRAYVAPIGGSITPDSISGSSAAHCSLHVAGPHHRVGAPADAADVDVVEQQPVDLDLAGCPGRRRSRPRAAGPGAEHAQRVGEHVAADDVHHDVDAPAVGQLLDGVLEPVDEHGLVGAGGARDVGLLLGARRPRSCGRRSPLATWMVAVPTPPAAPCTSTVSPARSRPRSASAKCAVR